MDNERRSREGRDHRDSIRHHTRLLCMAAFLAALSFLLGLLAKMLQGAGPLRLTVEGMPVVFAGITMGPVIGATVGATADLLSCILAGQAPLPLVTVGAAAVGAVSGIIPYFFCHRGRRFARAWPFPLVLLCDGAAHGIGSMLIKSIALSGFYGFNPLFFRVLIYLGVIALESYLLYALLRSAAIRREVERLTRQ